MERCNKRYLKWSDIEEKKLLEEIKTLPLELIANNHERSIGAITSRLCLIAQRLIDQGLTYDQVIEITKVSNSDLERFSKMKKVKLQSSITKNENEFLMSELPEFNEDINIVVKNLVSEVSILRFDITMLTAKIDKLISLIENP